MKLFPEALGEKRNSETEKENVKNFLLMRVLKQQYEHHAENYLLGNKAKDSNNSTANLIFINFVCAWGKYISHVCSYLFLLVMFACALRYISTFSFILLIASKIRNIKN